MSRTSPITGRYVYLDIDGIEYRVYYEEAGEGIPVLCQHTAGADGRQYRFLLEDEELASRFRFIAYDLPFHGRSLPPVSEAWWAQEYKLTKAFAMSAVLSLSQALQLESPVFMGCSIGGHLAADLAYHHPDEFRAVIGLEAAAHTDGMWNPLFWHPRVNMEFLPSFIYTITGPTAPEALRRETSWIYQQGAPVVFPGDNFYYGSDHDLTETAPLIDTSKVGVYVLSGEYDFSATPEACKAFADAVPGASYTLMPGLGHMPMSEDPELFKTFLGPVLDDIEQKSNARL